MLALKSHKLNAWLGGSPLRGVSPAIQVSNIAWEASDKPMADANAGQPGRRRGVKREGLKITIEFTLYEFASVSARTAAVEAVNAWAKDGYLEISANPGRRVWVQCVQRASVQEARDHHAAFTLVFETAENPFWEDAEPVTHLLQGSTASAQITVPGAAECVPAEVTVVPGTAVLNTLTLRLGDTAMSFSGLNVAAGDTLTLSHDPGDGRLVIACAAGSRYHCRSGDSADELTAPPGSATLSFTANVMCDVTFSLRGRYL